jgi:geranylgeranyl pyrophosphate synthase
MKVGLPRLEAVREDINRLLNDYYADRIKQAGVLHDEYGALWRAMETLGSNSGKRLRPYIMLMVYEGFGGTAYKDVLPVAAALEILHASILMHDDIIDRDYMRYGRPNVAGQYMARYAKPPFSGIQTEHYANSAALMAGDLALSGAYELILGCKLPAEVKIRAAQTMAHAIFVVAGGELLDTEAVLRPIETVDALAIARLKTSEYSFVNPLQMAATLAGADEKAHETLERMGQALGIAYQLADDVLGLFGDESVTGKPNTSDIKEGKRTYLMQRTLALTSSADHDRLMSILGRKSVTVADAEEVRSIVRDSGALTETQERMRSYITEAKQALRSLALKPDVQSELLEFMGHIISRDA